MDAKITKKPETFDQVSKVKEAVGQKVLRGDDRYWILGDPMVVEIDNTIVTISKGFTTDGASVPWIAQMLTGWRPWDEPHRWGAIVHDWLYCQRGVAKSYADEAFKATLLAAGTNEFRAYVMYLAVKFGGHHAYKVDQGKGPDIWK